MWIVSAGDEHASNHSAPGLWALLDRTPLDCWPSLLRGDKGFGNEGIMGEAERRALPYLFKLRLTPTSNARSSVFRGRAIGPIRARVGKPKKPRFDCRAGADNGAPSCYGGA